MNINTVKNILAFLNRADVKGHEAYAFVEAHQFVQSMLMDLEKQPGVLFQGLPTAPSQSSPAVPLEGFLTETAKG